MDSIAAGVEACKRLREKHPGVEIKDSGTLKADLKEEYEALRNELMVWQAA